MVWCYSYSICSQNSSPSNRSNTSPPVAMLPVSVEGGCSRGLQGHLVLGQGYAGSFELILQVGSGPARPSSTLEDIFSRPVSPLLSA